MAGNRDPQRRPVLYDLKNQRFLADPAIGSTYYPINLGGGGTYLTPADIGVTVQGYDATLLNAADIGITIEAYDPGILRAGDIGVSVQAYDAQLSDLAGLTPSNNAFVVGDGTNFVTETGDTARASLGVDAAYSVTTTATSKTLANRERCSVTAAGQTITLPASPQTGWEVAITVAGSFTNTVIARNGVNIMSLAEDLIIDRADVTVTLYYVDATRGWRII